MIGRDVLSVVPGLRREAESLMVDTAIVTRSGALTLNTSTGVLAPAAATTIYTGLCRLRQPSAEETEILFGDTQETRSRFIACFKYTVTAVAVDDVVTFTVSDDPDVLARSFRILSTPASTFVLYKGYPCEAVE